MLMKFRSLIMGLCLCLFAQAHAQRTVLDIRDWQFSRDRQTWHSVRIPHDWAIGGPFDRKWDLQFVAIEQNGEKVATEKSGRSGGLPWIGKGFYRTELVVLEGYGHAMLNFDGAMAEPVVYINGQEAGRWVYGYNAFQIDATPYLKAGQRNTIEVTLNNVEESSRWYPGGGLYRPVWLTLSSEAHIRDWGTFIRTTMAKGEGRKAVLVVSNHIEGLEHRHSQALVEYALLDAEGRCVARSEEALDALGNCATELKLSKARLWSPETPYLYTLRTRLTVDGLTVDETTNKVGVRTILVDDKGFHLNGKLRKFQGVCLHHDLGPLGAAVNRAALIRQIRILKDMGCDAIRTAHNMPSTMQMEVCDSMGMMVMAESFDMWLYPKCKNGYALHFGDWAERDMTNLILCHRNHPSIVMWSIGNEIPEQWSVQGRQLSRWLQDICHRLDPTRPVTQGMDKAEASLKSGFAQVMDVAGFNYRVHKFDQSISRLPQKVLLGSESASTVSSRGVYDISCSSPREAKAVTSGGFPLEGQCSSYDTDFCYWSNLPEADFIMMDDRPWTMGQFVWTGFDYLGEPTPYDEYWPSRSSYFGICDLAGLPKDRYYLYRSQWNRKDHTLHILPHWNWKRGDEVPVMVYTDFPEAELFLNGRSLGRQKKQPYTIPSGTAEQTKKLVETKGLLRRYRLIWDAVKYEPGELRVVAYDAEGRPAMEKTMHTAGVPTTLKLEADRSVIKAGGDDLAFITVSMRDSKGTLCPDASDKVSFDVSGAGTLRGLCNGDPTSLESFLGSEMQLFHGQLVLVLQSSAQPGKIRVTATSGSISSTMEISVE